MFSSFMQTIKGVITLILVGLNALFVSSSIVILHLLSFLIPVKSIRKSMHHSLCQQKFPALFGILNKQFLKISTKGLWDVQIPGNLKKDGSYLLISNHQSWFDILVLQTVFSRVVPRLVFFIKKQLVWQIPVVGLSMYVLGFPIISRHSKSDIRKNPKLKGQDIKTVKQACQKLKENPVTLITFVEGTRQTKEKYDKQRPPYKHLLKPRAGGISTSIHELHDIFDGIINVSIVYPKKVPNFFDFLSGKFNKIIVRAELLPVTEELIGDYQNDRRFRAQIQQWLNDVWQRNDVLIDKLNDDYEKQHTAHSNT